MSTPITCKLPGPEMRHRLMAITALAKRFLLSHEQDGRVHRLRYATAAAYELDELVSQERECCAFVDFDLEHRPDAVHLVITAPAEAAEFASVLTSHFLGEGAPQAAGCASSCGCGPRAVA